MSTRIQWIFLLLLGGLFVYGFVTFFEPYEEEQDLGWKTEALKNPYLAATLYAQSIGLETQEFDSFLKIPDLNKVDTLFATSSNQFLSEHRLDTLTKWLEQGGHLIVSAPENITDSDRLLNYLGLSIEETDYTSDDLFVLAANTDESRESETDANQASDTKQNEQKLSERLKNINEIIKEQKQLSEAEVKAEAIENVYDKIAHRESNISEDRITHLHFDDVDGRLKVNFDSSIGFNHSSFYENEDKHTDGLQAIYWRSDDYGIHFVQFELGYGLVSVLSNPEVFSSEQIDLFDHALLWDTLISNSESLTLVIGTNMPSLWALLKVYMPELLIAFSLFVFLWIWRNSRRFGPIHHIQHQQRRSLAEHINADAAFKWQLCDRGVLLQTLIDEIYLRAGKVITHFSQASEQEKITLLSDFTHIEPQTLLSILRIEKQYSEERFTQVVQILQKIRESL